MFIHEVRKSLFASFHVCLFPCRYLLSLCLCIFPWTCYFTKLLMSFVLCNWRNTLRWKWGGERIHITLDFILESKYFVGNYCITTYIFLSDPKKIENRMNTMWIKITMSWRRFDYGRQVDVRLDAIQPTYIGSVLSSGKTSLMLLTGRIWKFGRG